MKSSASHMWMVVFAILACTMTLCHAFEISRPAIKDSTIYRSTVSCPDCPERNCYKCQLGLDTVLTANTGGLAFLQALVGFQLPPIPASAAVTACSVQFPAFKKRLEYEIDVRVSMATTSDWDEATVTGENAPNSGDKIADVTVPALNNLGPIDITPACTHAAADGQFSIYLSAVFGHFEIWSKDSGNPAILHVTYS